MTNTVKVSAAFYFKGQEITPELVLDLDAHMEGAGCLPNLYPLLARVGKLDLYSYEYEMLQAENLIYTQAIGLVENHINNRVLDIAAFESDWKETKTLEKLTLIAKDLLGIENLDTQESLKKALLAAYQLGQS